MSLKSLIEKARRSIKRYTSDYRECTTYTVCSDYVAIKEGPANSYKDPKSDRWLKKRQWRLWGYVTINQSSASNCRLLNVLRVADTKEELEKFCKKHKFKVIDYYELAQKNGCQINPHSVPIKKTKNYRRRMDSVRKINAC